MRRLLIMPALLLLAACYAPVAAWQAVRDRLH